jgi:hypothetical protein
MRSFARTGLFTVALTALWVGTGFASPLSSSLLPLVPPGAEIVAGFENHRGPNSHGRLLLTTHNNRLDLDDWQALTGVDSKRVFDEVVEVAAAPSGGALSEHMLLVSGCFDRERIVRSLEENGAGSVEVQGQRILLINPLARERGDMVDVRWLAILDNRIGILGTEWLVQQALRRYADHAVPDSILEERLSLLRSDVTSWNVLVGSRKTTKNLVFAQPNSAWAQLQQEADVLTVAVRFGTKIRVDFSIHADAGHGPEFFTRKAGFFTDALGTGPGPDTTSPQDPHRMLQNFSLESNRVQGSVELTSSQFEAWCDHLYIVRASSSSSAPSGN